MQQPVHSLKKNLTRYISIFSVLLGCLLMGSAYYLALEETSEILDGQMRALAERVAQYHPEPILKQVEPNKKYHEEDLFVDVWLYKNGQQVQADQILIRQVQTPDYYHLQYQGEDWYSYVIPLQDRQVQVSQPMHVRYHLALELAWSIILPYLLIMPFAIWTLSWIIGISLKPLDDFKAELAQRHSDDLHLIQADDYPLEIRPTIDEMNQLFAKIFQAQAEQKQFIADAAHELRSPLTALNLQSKILMQEFPNSHALNHLHAGLIRMQHLVNQLLNLAKQDASLLYSVHNEDVHVKDVALNCIEQLMDLALQKDIDLGLTQQQDLTIIAHQETVHSIIYNILDNAIKYTPQQGMINLAIFEKNQWAVVEIEDSGKGIDSSYHEDVLKPFYRIDHHLEVGSGLGLSIVNRAVQRMNGGLEFSTSTTLGGLKVTLFLPISASPK